MNITLSSALEKRIQEMLESGAYASPSDLIAEALELLEDQQREYHIDLDSIRPKIQASMDAIENGQGIDGDQFFQDLIERSRAQSS